MCLNGKFSLSFLPLFGSLILGGCANSAIPEPSDLVCPAPDSAVMGVAVPDGVKMKRVNRALAIANADGLRIELSDTTKMVNAPGAFDDGSDTKCSKPDSRYGNKAYVGFTRYSGRLVSTLTAISVTVQREDANGALPSVYLLVDCDGDGAWDPTKDTVVAPDFTLPRLSLVQGVATTLRFEAGENIWRYSSGAGCGLPNIIDFMTPAKSLATLPPTAQLLDARPMDCGMPRCTHMPSIGFTSGDSRSNQSSVVKLRSATLEWQGMSLDSYQFGQ